jgi:glycosyltransferase involved in cell wall biosynthesis
MKILWLSNKVLTNSDDGSTGTWLGAIAWGLVQSGQVTLGNISTGSVSKAIRQDYGLIQQWVVPSSIKLMRNGLPAKETVAYIVRTAEEFSPDLVHVWGTESYWGLLTARKLIREHALLEMQGVKGAIAKVYHGGLSFREQMACIRLKEVLRLSMIWQEKKRFQIWAEVEREIISQHKNIIVQTKWAESQVKGINLNCRIYQRDFALREAFYKSMPWQFSKNPVVFCSAAYSAPFKGLHVAIRAIAILKSIFPNIKLRIAGGHQKKGIRQDGYVAWLNRETEKLKVKSNIAWLGPLSATQVTEELRKCSAVVLPTFVESYCLALAEAMVLGVPAVVSCAGGTLCLSKDEESALFFPPGDESMCAYQLQRVLTDQKLAKHLSKHARMIALERNNREKVVNDQIEIYQQIISDAGGKRL